MATAAAAATTLVMLSSMQYAGHFSIQEGSSVRYDSLVCTANIYSLAGCGLLSTRWLANPLAGLAPLGPVFNFSRKNTNNLCKKVPQKVQQKDSALCPGPFGESFDFFPKIIPSLGGPTQKKYFEVTHRVQGEVHAKFGWNPSSSLGFKSEQTSKQPDTPLSYVYIRIDIGSF